MNVTSQRHFLCLVRCNPGGLGGDGVGVEVGEKLMSFHPIVIPRDNPTACLFPIAQPPPPPMSGSTPPSAGTSFFNFDFYYAMSLRDRPCLVCFSIVLCLSQDNSNPSSTSHLSFFRYTRTPIRSPPPDLSFCRYRRIARCRRPRSHRSGDIRRTRQCRAIGKDAQNLDLPSLIQLYSLDPTHDHTHGASSSTTTPPVLDRDDSIAYAARREHSRIRKPWWKRPSPYWSVRLVIVSYMLEVLSGMYNRLLLIQLGGAISMGMGVAPKAEIYNQLAWLVYFAIPFLMTGTFTNLPAR